MCRFFFALFASLIIISSHASASALHIEQTEGPSAGAIKFGLAVSPKNPNIIYVDRYKSTDAGESWAEIDLPTFLAVNAIGVKPSDPNSVFIGASNHFLKSTDGGETWKEIGSLGDGSNVITTIAVNAANESELFVGTTGGKLFFSADSGESFSDISARIGASSPVSRIAFNPTKPDEVFVSTGSWYWSSLVSIPKTGNGLFKSEDGGRTFSRAGSEFSDMLVQDVDAVGDEVFAATYANPGSVGEWHGLFRSDDGGKTWKNLLDTRKDYGFPILALTHVAVKPSEPNKVIVSSSTGVGGGAPGFLLSQDSGETWEGIYSEDGSTEPVQYTHELRFFDNSSVYAVDYYRPFMKSDDEGRTWKWASHGIKRSVIKALEVHPTNRNNVMAGTIDGALHITYDGGKTWERIFSGLAATYLSTIEFNPANPDLIFFGVSGPFSLDGRYYGEPTKDTGIYTSGDGGKTWAKSGQLPSPDIAEHQAEVYDILVHPNYPELVLVATSGQGVYRSEDTGKTFSESNAGIPKEGFYWNLNFDSPGENEDEIHCKEEVIKGLARNWNCFYYATRTSMSLFVNPNNADEVWYTTLNGIFVSGDRGKTWEWLSDDLKNIHVHYMAFDPTDPKTTYVGTHQGAIGPDGNVIDSRKGLLISRDGGKTWQQVSEGPGEGRDIRAIAVSPENPDFVAVGTDAPFFVSEDKGKTWREIKLSESVAQVDLIRIDSTAKIIYLGTLSTGVWRGIIGFDSNSPSVIDITGISAPPSVAAGMRFDVIVSVDNIGGQEAPFEVSLEVADQKITKGLTLPAAGTALLKHTFSIESPGKYGILVNGLEYGSIDVVEAEDEARQDAASAPAEQGALPASSAQQQGMVQAAQPKGFAELLMDALLGFIRWITGSQ